MIRYSRKYMYLHLNCCNNSYFHSFLLCKPSCITCLSGLTVKIKHPVNKLSLDDNTVRKYATAILPPCRKMNGVHTVVITDVSISRCDDLH